MSKINKIFQTVEIPYNVRKVNKLVLIIQKTTDQKLIDKSNMQLFNYMKKVVDKNVNNYLLLVRNSGIRDGYEVNELTIECFIILSKCIKKYKVSKKNNFYFYYNKSLSRTLFRIFEKEQKHNVERSHIQTSAGDLEGKSTLSNRDEMKLSNNIELSVEGILLDTLNMTEVEKLICISKVKEQKREDFLIENPTITNNTYYLSMKSIKVKLLKLKQNGEL